MGIENEAGYETPDFSIRWVGILKPFTMQSDHHQHDYDQYLCFVGGNPANILDLGGEVELTLSEDGVNLEKHVFTTAATVFIPAGLYHCPLVYTRVDRPLFFINVMFTKTYRKV